jgi:hypothetical protein
MEFTYYITSASFFFFILNQLEVTKSLSLWANCGLKWLNSFLRLVYVTA